MIGIVLVAAVTAGIQGLLAKITATRWFTNSAASAGKLVLIIRPPILNCYVLTLNMAGLLQPSLNAAAMAA